MRTVQELLKIADEEKLFRSFDNRLAKHYFQNMPEDMTGKEYFDRRRKRFSDLYQRLTAIPIKEDEDGQHVLFAVPQLKDDLLGIEHSAELCKVEELLKDYRTAATYAYEFTEQEVIIGWFVAETDITLQHMYDLLTNILFEATFFGMEQEYLEEEMKKLEESAAEAKEMRAHPEKDTSRPADEVIEEMETAGVKCGKRIRVSKFVRVAVAAAAVVALLLSTAAIASALGYDVWGRLGGWTRDNLHFSVAPSPEADIHGDPYRSLRDSIENEGVTVPVVPHYLPEGYVLKEVASQNNNNGTTIVAIYAREDNCLYFDYLVHPDTPNLLCPKDIDDPVIYSREGIDHYVMTNEGKYRAIWRNGSVICDLSGFENEEELQEVIDSVYWG